MEQWWVVVEVSDRAGLVTAVLSTAGRKAAWLQKLLLAGAGPQKHCHPGTMLPVGMVLGLHSPHRHPISFQSPPVHHFHPISHCCFPVFSEVASSLRGSGSFSLIIPAFTDPQAARAAAPIQIHPHAVFPSESTHCPPTARKHRADEGLLPVAFIRENPSPCALPGGRSSAAQVHCLSAFWACSSLTKMHSVKPEASTPAPACSQAGASVCGRGAAGQRH